MKKPIGNNQKSGFNFPYTFKRTLYKKYSRYLSICLQSILKLTSFLCDYTPFLVSIHYSLYWHCNEPITHPPILAFFAIAIANDEKIHLIKINQQNKKQNSHTLYTISILLRFIFPLLIIYTAYTLVHSFHSDSILKHGESVGYREYR